MPGYPIYGSLFGDDPDRKVNDFVTGHAVVEASAIAVERAGTFDTDAVGAELNKFQDEPCVVGKTSFLSELPINVKRPMVITEATTGKPTSLGLFGAEKDPEIRF